MRVVAIDGVLGSGKTSVARLVAERTGLEYLDTGAMYRSVALRALLDGVDMTKAAAGAGPDRDSVLSIARRAVIEVGVDSNGEQVVRVDGITVTTEIRRPDVAKASSLVATIAEVRAELVSRQRAWAHSRGGGVLEGRDIASVVFPDAGTKVFLTASVDERARRRHGEQSSLSLDEIRADLEWRDHNDASRAADPLKVVEGATVIDTTGSSILEVVDKIAALVPPRLPTPVAPIAVQSESPPPLGSNDTIKAEKRQLARSAQDLAKPITRGQRVVFEITRLLFVPLVRVFFRVRYVGLENVPRTGAFIAAPSHRSNVDFALLPGITKRRMRFLGKDSIWKFGFLSTFFDSLGGIPVRRGTTDRESMKICAVVLDQGEPLVVFPEGTRQSGPIIQELFDGAAFLASKHNAVIVPIGIGGSESAMKKGAKFPRPVKLTVVVGKPIPAPTGGRAAVKTATAVLHGEVQRLFDEATALRR